MTAKSSYILQHLLALADEGQAKNLSRFFKTGPGDYGFGDKFLGIRVPQTRGVVKEVKGDVELADAVELTASEWHEVRLAGFLLIIELYLRAKRQGDEAQCRLTVETYTGLIPRGNNWDLVDLVCPYILGDYLTDHPTERNTLYQLAQSPNLWENRAAIVSTLALIRRGCFADTKRLAIILMPHPHDLIHKATGWMLREMGKRNEQELISFLDQHAAKLPRTALRYATERLNLGVKFRS